MFGLIKPVAMVTVKYLGHTALIFTSQTYLVKSTEPASVGAVGAQVGLFLEMVSRGSEVTSE